MCDYNVVTENGVFSYLSSRKMGEILRSIESEYHSLYYPRAQRLMYWGCRDRKMRYYTSVPDKVGGGA